MLYNMWPFIRYQSIILCLRFFVGSKFNCSRKSRSAALRSQILCPVKIALFRLIHSTCSGNVPRLFTQLTSNLARTGLSGAFCFRSSIPAESKMTYRVMHLIWLRCRSVIGPIKWQCYSMNGGDKAKCIRSNPKPTFYYFPPTSIKLILVMMGLVRYIVSEVLSFCFYSFHCMNG